MIGGAGASKLVGLGVTGTAWGQSRLMTSGGMLKLITEVGNVLVFFAWRQHSSNGLSCPSWLVGRFLNNGWFGGAVRDANSSSLSWWVTFSHYNETSQTTKTYHCRPVRGTPNPPAEPRRPAEPTHQLSRLDTHQHPSTAPPSPPTSHRRCPSLLPVNRLTTPTPTGTNRSTVTTGLYVPHHLRTLRPWGPFYLSFHFYFLFLYCVIPHTIVSSLYMASLARNPYPFLFGSPARCVDYVVYYCIIY